ncbi:16S rRNA (cytosine(1402)-N(4))-methyltransferase RsmH [Paroceanicella profunda]|uniref:Ribosomal RNA small subunit methyltransferase H n=1 Tax=Paroceanicella profunda TaxID=2579971 RepID=A0A5B8FWU0_9RHOB|nr:16S rRNA (cytosine(1402)-N(4))-methyltransferase RsmH [Paroceanicella profunda]QDL90513.1 16S rRNA (cytosine(1402)-N(4))-methyltransferase RsmH [Paroceanicella profunda]
MTVSDQAPHIPVLLDDVIAAVAPVSGTWIDGTFGAGGYARALVAAGAEQVIGIDRDPAAHALAAGWLADYAGRIRLESGVFGALDSIAAGLGCETVDGVVLDIGVSSMQLDEAGRGFSFMREGPLDMRMGQDGPTAADLVNTLDEAALADLLYLYGEERASRRIARRIVAVRATTPFVTTLDLARVVESCLPRARPGQPHPATRSFQALRIAVNDELGELVRGLAAAERALAPGGLLAVVTFHSLEDRIVKRFIQSRSGEGQGNSRHAPEARGEEPRFEKRTRKAIGAGKDEARANPRARSAKLRVARRLEAPAGPVDPRSLGLPELPEAGARGRG